MIGALLLVFLTRYIPQWVKDFSVSLLTPEYQNDGQYKISDLKKFFPAKDGTEQEVFIFTGIDGNRYIDSSSAESEEELILGGAIYFLSEKIVIESLDC